MGQLLTVVGYAVGSYFGYPQLGAVIGAAVGAATTKGPNQTGPRLNDLRVQGTEYGQTIPWVAGRPRLAGQVVWSSGLREIANVEKQGKGGGGKTTTFTYEVDLLIVLTENVSQGVSREWLNGGLVYNGSEIKEGTWASLTIYTGEADQLPDPIYEAAVGVGNAPAYRGRTSILIQSLQLGNHGQIPNMTSEVGVSFGTDLNYVFIGNFNGTYNDTSSYGIVANVVEALPAFGYALGPGRFSTGLSYVGTPSFGNVAYVAYLNPAYDLGEEPFTMGFWINMDAYPGGLGDFLFWLRNESATSNCGFQGTTTGIRFFSDFSAPVNVPLTLDVWTYIAASRNGAGLVKVYKDGVLVGSTSASSAGSGASQLILHGNDTANSHIACTLDACFVVAGTDMYPADFDPPNRQPSIIGEDALLPDVVEALMLRADYNPDEFDVSGIEHVTQPVRGIAIGTLSSTRAPLETLQSVFFFDSYTSDKVYFRTRQTEPVADIPFRDLIVGQNGEPLELTLGSELELPAQISLSYANVLNDYNVGTEHSDRILTGQETNEDVRIGLGMTPSEAKRAVDANLFDRLASLTRTNVCLPLKYAFIVPGDPFLVTDREGRKYRVRSMVKRDSLVRIEHECIFDDVRALISDGITAEDYVLVEDIVQVAQTVWATMDVPPLRDADAGLPGPYVAITPRLTEAETEWPGAVYVRSWGAEDFQQIFTSGARSVMGTCDTELADFVGRSYVFDETQKLRVRVYGELASTTRDDMLDDLAVNAMAVGEDGRWEILRYRTADLIDTEDGQNIYDLSGFVRGMRGTEHNMGNHEVGDTVVLLGNALRRMVNQNSDIDAPSEVKAVTLNTFLSSVTAEEFTDRGVALEPFSVANLRALPDGSDMVLDWQRRSRMSYRYGGSVGVSVPLGELIEAYVVSVYDGATFIKAYPTTAPTFTYLAADIAADGFSPGDPITFIVAQVSDVVGQGFTATVQGIAP